VNFFANPAGCVCLNACSIESFIILSDLARLGISVSENRDFTTRYEIFFNRKNYWFFREKLTSAKTYFSNFLWFQQKPASGPENNFFRLLSIYFINMELIWPDFFHTLS
jgi:hypothetical protein